MKRKPVPPMVKHATHETQVRTGKGPHAGELYCLKCRKHIAWLNARDYAQLT